MVVNVRGRNSRFVFGSVVVVDVNLVLTSGSQQWYKLEENNVWLL